MRRFSRTLKRTLWVFLLFPVFSLAQAQVSITGKVTIAAEGESLPGVNIIEKGTTNGTITDLDGNYKLTVSGSDAILVFSSIGYLAEEVPVGNQSQIDMGLVEDIADLEEVVVVGYGGIKRKELTGSVTSVSSDAILKTASSDLNSALQGQMAGVSVQASSGAPGAQANIQIRGVGSFSAASVTPLYVIDGIPFDGVPNLSPEEIETIDISKDGATAAIYGTRASNGVIQITTKKGQSGQLKVDYSTYYGIQNITSGIELMETEHQIFTFHTRALNMGQEGTSIFINAPDALSRNNNFQEFVTVDNAPIMNHSISLSGGTEDANLRMTTTYFSQEGVLKNSDYSSLSTRINGTVKKERFSAFSSLSIKLDDRQASPWGIYEESIRQLPYGGLPEEGFNTSLNTSNPIFYGSFAQRFSDRDTRTSNTLNANLNLKYEIIDGLSLQVTAGGSLYNYRRKFWEPQYFISNADGEIVPNASRVDARMEQRWHYQQRWTAESVVNYRKSILKHNFTVTAGYSLEATDRYEEIASKSDFLSNETQVFNAGNELTGISGFETQHRIEGTLGRLNYNYDERYLFSGSIRYDGSSNFGPENRRKAFWGMSGGWNISEEAFFAPVHAYVDMLKVRASLAEVGNERIPGYLYIPVIYPGSNYHFGPEGSENLASGSTQRSYPNEMVQWETKISKNVGLDATFLNGRVGLTFDAYHDSKEDMLIPVDISPAAGTWIPRSGTNYRTIYQNVGNMVNKGIELDLKYQGRYADLNWSVQGVFSKNVNEVTSLPESLGEYALGGGAPILYTGQPQSVNFVVEGESVPTFMLIPTDGVIKDSAELAAYEEQWSEPTGAQLGDLRYVDANGDSISDEYDRVPMGSPLPDFELGLNLRADYKGIDLSVQLFYSHGGEIYNGAKALAYQQFRHQDLYYQWSPANPDSDIPSLRSSYEHRNYRVYTDRFIEDATYLRIRNITLGYTLPKQWVNKVKLDRVRFYLSAQNAFTFTKYTGFDPEVGYTTGENNGGDALFSRGVDRGNYPASRQYRAGLNISF